MTQKRKRRPVGGGAVETAFTGCGTSTAYHSTAPLSINRPRLHLQISRESDGHAVSLHGVVGGRLVTLARGLTESEAHERAEAEAAERGIEVRT
jgi:hypothetical protein